MKAIAAYRYGTPEVLQIIETARPIPGNQDVLVRVHASTLSAADCAMRRGDPFFARLFTGLTKPKHAIPGDVVAGEIVDVGSNVTRFKKGDRVYGASGMDFSAHAEYTCLSAPGSLAHMPGTLTYIEAAAVVDGALTALPFLRDAACIKSGQHVLINGAAGSVGSMAVQLATYYGAHVTGVCSTSNFERVHALGAKDVIDYNKSDFTQSGQAYDVIFDAVGKTTFAKGKRALKSGGIYLSTVPTLSLMLQMMGTSKGKGKRAVFVATGLRKSEEKSKDLAYLTSLLEEGKIHPVIDRSYPMEQVSDAHAYVEKGHKKGAVVLLI